MIGKTERGTKKELQKIIGRHAVTISCIKKYLVAGFGKYSGHLHATARQPPMFQENILVSEADCSKIYIITHNLIIACQAITLANATHG